MVAATYTPYPHFRLICSARRVALAPHRSLSAVVHRTAHPLYIIIIIIITIIVGIIIYIIPPSAFRSRFPPWPSFLCIFDFAHCGASSFRAWVSFDTGLSHSTAPAFFASSSSLQSCSFLLFLSFIASCTISQSLLLRIVCLNFGSPSAHVSCISLLIVTPRWVRHSPFVYIVLSLASDRKSTRLNSSHSGESRMPSSA